MSSEQIAVVALLVAIVSLIISAAQWISANAEKKNNRRTLLLQRILEAKSANYINGFELDGLLRQHASKMDGDQIAKLKGSLQEIHKMDEEFEILHGKWKDYEDGKTLIDMEKESVHIDVMVSDARDTSKLIENGRKSYE
jgi:hypothetical protein